MRSPYDKSLPNSLDYPLYTRRPRHQDETVVAGLVLIAFVVLVLVVAVLR
jgi:hypothetical protein